MADERNEHPKISSLLIELINTDGYNILREYPSPSLLAMIADLDQGTPFNGGDALEEAAVAATMSALFFQKLVYELQSQLKPAMAVSAAQMLKRAVKLANDLHQLRDSSLA
jgi:hypothetical protein